MPESNTMTPLHAVIPDPLPGQVTYSQVADAFSSMTQEVFEVNEANGWFEFERPFPEDIALLHSEVSEMLEAFRDHALDDATVGAKPEGVGAEAADVFIRLLDTCRRAEVNLAAEYVRKMAYNRTRGYRHGGKRI